MAEKLLPIVPGCRALVIDGEANSFGIFEVRVVELVAADHPERPPGMYENFWIVDSEACRAYCRMMRSDGIAFRESKLYRIDGGSFLREEHEHAVHDFANAQAVWLARELRR